ncbi:uncharacterized protein LOC100198614 isoform X2 [Hydra vulgaris]|uniref:Uncharacterized protein LOC100198614 isoform X2 n=2 Tax=Hydra vulgaris TaxID=6087 RepID=A0ABM4BQH8_HYDVU
MVRLVLVIFLITIEKNLCNQPKSSKVFKRNDLLKDTFNKFFQDVPLKEKLPEYILDSQNEIYSHVKEQFDVADDISKKLDEMSKLPNTQQKLEMLINEASKKNTKIQEIKNIYDTVMKLSNDKNLPEIVDGVVALGGSLMEVVDGVVRGHWQDMLEGGLNIIQSLLVLAGPMGAIISTAMSLVSAIFGLFGGSVGSKKVSENQEGMIKRVIDDALKRSRAKELKSDAEGLKKEINSVRNSINQFREESSITEDQAILLYNQAFLGVSFFGKLKVYIDEYCDCTSYKGDEDSKRGEFSGRCLEFLNLYSDISILRQLLIADMASVIGSFNNMDKLAVNLLKLTDKEKVSDKEVLTFLLDPINNRAQRFCITQYFGAPNRYPTIQLYLSKLSKIPEGKPIPGKAVICSAKELLGLCQELELTQYDDLKEWEDKVKSLYVPQRVLVYGFSQKLQSGASFGPFPGPTVIGLTPGEWKSILIVENKNDINQFVRICEAENMEQTGRCDFLKVQEYPFLQMAIGTDHGVWTKQGKKCIFPFKDKDGVEHNSCVDGLLQFWCAIDVKSDLVFSEHGECLFPETWENKVESISIPDGIQVEMFSEVQFQGKKIGPFYGPNTINKLCGGKNTKSMTVSKTDVKTAGMVLICSEKSFSGMCDYVEPEKYSKLIFHGCNWNEKKASIKSIRVPDGLAVAMWTKVDFEGMPFGPYTGPVSVPEVDDGYTANEFQINSMNIEKVTKSDLEYEKTDFSVRRSKNYYKTSKFSRG